MDRNWDEVTDVIVAGSGAAGCSAALGALHSGAQKVLMVEKSKNLFGGTTKLAGGGWLWCPNNRYLKSLGVHQDSEEIFELLKDLAYPQTPENDIDANDLQLLRTFAKKWPEICEWFQKEGILNLGLVEVRDGVEDPHRVENLIWRKWATTPEFTEKTGISEDNIKALSKLMPSYCAEHPLDLCPSGKVLYSAGNSTARYLEKAVRHHSSKFDLRMGTAVVDIVFDGRECVGAKVMDFKTKAVSRVRARKGVIFGTGGFSHNKELMKTQFIGKKITSCAAKTNTGDLISICETHGIPLSGMNLSWWKQEVLPSKPRERVGVFFVTGDSYFVCDRTGRRFACETNFYQQRGLQMLNDPEKQYVFYICDKRNREMFDGPVKSLGGPIPLKDTGEDALVYGKDVAELFQGLQQRLKEIDPNFSLSENFAKNLSDQIKRFNQFASSGADLEFGRGTHVAEYCWHTARAADNQFPNRTMHPINPSELCAVVMGISTLDTKGGPRISVNGQILDKNGQGIRGLYGAGNCTRNYMNLSYPASGVTISSAICFGFLSGRDAMVQNRSVL